MNGAILGQQERIGALLFTGIVTHIGRIVGRRGDADVTLEIESGLDLANIQLGASIAHSGVCLTIVSKAGRRHTVQASGETLARTTLGGWQVGHSVNLEGSLRLGDELGGHIVFGHVDGLGTIAQIEPVGECFKLSIDLPAGGHAAASVLPSLVAEKGSIAIDGISLTINAVHDRSDGSASIDLMIIPHTWTHTTLAGRTVGDPVNVEADMLARYVARQTTLRSAGDREAD